MMIIATTIALMAASAQTGGFEIVRESAAPPPVKVCNDVCQGARILYLDDMSDRLKSILPSLDNVDESLKNASERYSKCYGRYFAVGRVKAFQDLVQIDRAVSKAQSACLSEKKTFDKAALATLHKLSPGSNLQETNQYVMMLRAIYVIAQIGSNFSKANIEDRFDSYVQWVGTSAPNH